MLKVLSFHYNFSGIVTVWHYLISNVCTVLLINSRSDAVQSKDTSLCVGVERFLVKCRTSLTELEINEAD